MMTPDTGLVLEALCDHSLGAGTSVETGLAHALNEIRVAAKGRRWLANGELGSYTAEGCGEGDELTREAVLREVSWMIEELEKIAAEALGRSGTIAYQALNGAPSHEDRVKALEAGIREEIAEQERLVEYVGGFPADRHRRAAQRLRALLEDKTADPGTALVEAEPADPDLVNAMRASLEKSLRRPMKPVDPKVLGKLLPEDKPKAPPGHEDCCGTAISRVRP